MVLGIILSPFQWLGPNRHFVVEAAGSVSTAPRRLTFELISAGRAVRRLPGCPLAAGRRGCLSVPYGNTFGGQCLLNARAEAQTFGESRESGEPASHVIAGAHAPPVEHEPERIDDAESAAKRILA